MQKNLI